ncbi:MAG: hypothetical protein JWO07_98, partial [Candidatus Saccharibacteria bacterium]|nr:hypothetical protein [Candidatus Saccharibacteria bacterium]
MKITKFEHACLVVEKDGKKVVVDPGAYTTSLGTPEGVIAIVITHEHQDHFLIDHVKRIIEANPDAKVLAHESLKDQLEGLPFQAVTSDTGINVGPFHFEFFGKLHTQVHPSIPQVPNLGVMIDDYLYYPGDSYTVPTKLVTILALPVNGPWAKFSQTVDYMMELKPKV